MDPEQTHALAIYEYTLIKEMQERMQEYLRQNGLAKTPGGEVYATAQVYLKKPGLGDSIERLMKERNITPAQLASEIHVHQSSIYYWINHDKTPSLHNLIAIAKALKVSPGLLMDIAAN